MTKKINHIELKNLLKEYYAKKQPLFIWGRFGIGKSETIRNTAVEIAKDKSREFIEWNKINEEQKQNVFENPSKYFVLIDIRLSE